jgi:ERCC4-type nuclease
VSTVGGLSLVALTMKLPTILVDTREKNPLIFRGYTSRKETLHTGDYSLHGLRKIVTVEYKSLADWCIWITERDKKRFQSQLERLADYERSCIVVGGRLGSKTRYSHMPERKIVEKAAEVASYNIPIIFCKGRLASSQFIISYLEQVYQDVNS